MKHTVGVSLAAAMLAGCSTQADVTAKNKNAALKAWGDCVMATVVQLDDGHSDPTNIAYRISPRCADLYTKLTDLVASQFKTDDGQLNMRKDMQTNEIKTITSAVLIHRSHQSEGWQPTLPAATHQ